MISSALVLSDLHFEFDVTRQNYNDVVSEKLADAVFLAGDIAGGLHALEFIDHLLDLGYTVFYCLGNHEFYGHDIDGLVAQWREVQRENFYFLHRDVVEVDNLQVVGAPLWASVDTLKVHPIHGFQRQPIDWFVRQHIKGCADFSEIENFTPEGMADAFWQDLRFLESALSQDSNLTTVVMTHYLPSLQSVARRFQGNKSNAIFVSELEPLIESTNIRLWVHGHTHDRCHYHLSGTEVICNPRGYHDNHMLNREFSWEELVRLA